MDRNNHIKKSEPITKVVELYTQKINDALCDTINDLITKHLEDGSFDTHIAKAIPLMQALTKLSVGLIGDVRDYATIIDGIGIQPSPKPNVENGVLHITQMGEYKSLFDTLTFPQIEAVCFHHSLVSDLSERQLYLKRELRWIRGLSDRGVLSPRLRHLFSLHCDVWINTLCKDRETSQFGNRRRCAGQLKDNYLNTKMTVIEQMQKLGRVNKYKGDYMELFHKSNEANTLTPIVALNMPIQDSEFTKYLTGLFSDHMIELIVTETQISIYPFWG